MKTRDRILQASLELFNHEGEARVSTNHIADELDISPGNLYYHFDNKEAIILEIFREYKREIERLLMAPEDRAMDMEDMWLFLHLVFETIWRYRFFYRNLVDLTRRIRSLRIQFQHILRQKVDAARAMCQGLVDGGAMSADPEEIEALSRSIALVATYWLNFSIAAGGDEEEEQDLGPAVYQVMSLVLPYLAEAEREHLKALAQAYVD
ncbi:MAG: TetR/AcrR family transcriptional regulator [Xanthomonadales bacterium]|nr:TetR/AcrR family transcriptional regulator [Xanthomonadales bacterium]